MIVYKNVSDSDLHETNNSSKENVLDIKGKRMIFNNYKTAGTYKTQIVKIPNNLMELIKKKLNITLKKKYLMGIVY